MVRFFTGLCVGAGIVGLFWATKASAEIVRVPDGIVCETAADMEALWLMGNQDRKLDMSSAAEAVNLKVGRETCRRSAFLLELGSAVGHVTHGDIEADIVKVTIYALCGEGLCIHIAPHEAFGTLATDSKPKDTSL
jgi:hypothetical protein